MKSLPLDPSTLGVGTRALLAAGAGLMLAGRMSVLRRQKLGTALMAAGAATTVPALLALRRAARRGETGSVGFSRALRGASRFPRKGDDVADDDVVLRDDRAYRMYEFDRY